MSEKRLRTKGDFFLARLERFLKESRRLSLRHPARLSSVDETRNNGQPKFRPSDLRLDPGDPEDWLILRAFETAGLDRNDPGDFKEFARLVSSALYGEKIPKWTHEINDELLSDYEREYAKHPELSPEEVCHRLLHRSLYKAKYKGESAEYLLKRV